MKISFYSALFVVLFASCQDKNENTTPATSTTAGAFGNVHSEIAGTYSDTLPCADCPGIITELTLYPDTTFIRNQRRLSASQRPERGQKIKGVYSIEDGMTRLKLTSTMAPAETMVYKVGKDVLVDVSAGENPSQDLSLEMQERNMGRYGDDYLTYRLKDDGRFPKVVYSHFPGSDIVINKPMIDASAEPLKAVMTYYASKYDTGCNGDRCALETALGLDQSQMKEYAAKWMPSAKIEERNKDLSLVMILFSQRENKLQVNYNVITADRIMSQAVDEFEISETEARLINQGNLKQLGKN